MIKNELALVLLDEATIWNKGSKVLVNWSDINVPHNHESLPLKVEETATKIKREYLTWVYELSRLRIRGKTLVSDLKLSDSFSFWWMTLIAEKSHIKARPFIRFLNSGPLNSFIEREDVRDSFIVDTT